LVDLGIHDLSFRGDLLVDVGIHNKLPKTKKEWIPTSPYGLLWMTSAIPAAIAPLDDECDPYVAKLLWMTIANILTNIPDLTVNF
jgi:hypothetical protein